METNFKYTVMNFYRHTLTLWFWVALFKLGQNNPELERNLNSEMKLKKQIQYNLFCLKFDDRVL